MSDLFTIMRKMRFFLNPVGNYSSIVNKVVENILGLTLDKLLLSLG